jgi:hypothetical protein
MRARPYHGCVDGLRAVEGVAQPPEQLLSLVFRCVDGWREILDRQCLAVQLRQEAVVSAVLSVDPAHQPRRCEFRQCVDAGPILDSVDRLRLPRGRGTHKVDPYRVARQVRGRDYREGHINNQWVRQVQVPLERRACLHECDRGHVAPRPMECHLKVTVVFRLSAGVLTGRLDNCATFPLAESHTHGNRLFSE